MPLPDNSKGYVADVRLILSKGFHRRDEEASQLPGKGDLHLEREEAQSGGELSSTKLNAWLIHQDRRWESGAENWARTRDTGGLEK